MLYDRINKVKTDYRLSILILSSPKRLQMLETLYNEIEWRGKSVQILYLGDNYSMTVGEKRNLIRDIAKGKYVMFIDDDDHYYPGAIDKILEATEQGPDVITFNVYKTYNGKYERSYVMGKQNGRAHLDPSDPKKRRYKMFANHLCAWKKEIAVKEEFPHISRSEDHKWAEKINMHIKNEIHIDEYLYHYDYQSKVTETQSR